MAQFQNMIITRAGLDMIAQSQAGGTLIFTKGKLGDGQIGDQSIPDLTDLINAKMSVELSSVTAKTEGHVEVRFIVDNTDLNVGFFVREVGIFAKVNEEGVEKLYGYANAGNYTNYLADKTVPIDIIITKIDLVVGNASNVAFTTDKSIVYVTLEDMEDALAAHDADDGAHNDMVGATTDAAGKRGMVPAPTAGAQNNFLTGAGTYQPVATTEQAKAGMDDTAPMTALKVKQALEAAGDVIAVGDVVYRPYLKVGYVKANGATVLRSDYPSLAAFATAQNLWTETPTDEPWKYGVGDGSTTMVLPDYRGRVIQGGDSTAKLEAGLPNIYGSFITVDADGWMNGTTAFARGNYVSGNWNYGEYFCREIRLNANLCNPIYRDISTVQPAAISMMPQIRF